jgi:DMSO reductase anchor subunit
VHAYRALRMWRRSWLSREVLLFTAFAGAASVYAALLWLDLPGSAAAGGLTVALGLGGVIASACIYRVPARPAWNSRHTVAHFLLTAGTLGPLCAAAVGAGDLRWLALAAATLGGAQLGAFALHFFRCNASDDLALRGTARLLSSVLAPRVVARGALLVTGAIALPLAAAGPFGGLAAAGGRTALAAAALAAALAAEILGRFLFFVSVVPRHQAAPYVAAGREAA